MKQILLGLLISVGFIASFTGCKTKEDLHVSVLPTVEGAILNFRGFVTDDDEELVSQVYNFSMKIVGNDTIKGRPAYRYERNDEIAYFYTDEDGTVWEFNTTDVGKRIVIYNFSYREPMLVQQWQILLKMDEGVGTEWSASVDTTFEAITMAGVTQTIRYKREAKARFEGWEEVFIPEPYAHVKVLDAHWFELNTLITNETTGDTLFATFGNAHHYFDPELGAVKYITDFTKKEIGQSAVPLRGTWELISKVIPE